MGDRRVKYIVALHNLSCPNSTLCDGTKFVDFVLGINIKDFAKTLPGVLWHGTRRLGNGPRRSQHHKVATRASFVGLPFPGGELNVPKLPDGGPPLLCQHGPR